MTAARATAETMVGAGWRAGPSPAPYLSLIIFLIFIVISMVPVTSASTEGWQCLESTIRVYVDGSVEVNETINVTGAPVEVEVEAIAPPLAAGAWQDGVGLPVAFNDSTIIIPVYDNGTLIVTYVTLEATSKEGAIWRLNATLPCPLRLVLPASAVPVRIEPENFQAIAVGDRIALLFPGGHVYIEYLIAPQAVGGTTTTTPSPTGGAGEGTTTMEGGNSAETTGEQPEGGGSPSLVAVGAAAGIAVASLLVAARRVLRGRERGEPPLQGPLRGLDERDQKILEALESGPKTAADLMRETGIPKTPLYRRLRRLVEEGLVEAYEEEGVRRYRLAKRGG